MIKLLCSFFKVGLIGFGGGSALIPIIEREVVTERGWVSPQRYNDFVIVANITPGALPVKLAAAVGKDVAGLSGMVAAPIAVALPSVAATLASLALLARLGGNLVTYISYAAVGISAFISYLLLRYIRRVLEDCRRNDIGASGLAVVLMVFALTCGSELRGILGLSGTPLLDISAVRILILAFFIIFFTQGHVTRFSAIIVGELGFVYLLMSGKAGLIDNASLELLLYLTMGQLAAYGLYMNLRGRPRRGRLQWKELLKETVCWLVLALATLAPALFTSTCGWSYASQGLLSTLTSFGGGEAYLAVADSIFVSSGQVDGAWFYSQLLPIANALPGPLLCKLLSGAGYALGGWLAALCGFGMGLAASCGAYFLVYHVYTSFDQLEVFRALRQWVLPIVCGLLISTMAAMLLENMKSAGPVWGLLLSAAALAMNLLLGTKTNIGDLGLVFASGVLSLAVLILI